MEQIKRLYETYKAPVHYLFWGGCTTGINIVVYALCARKIGIGTVGSNTIAWAVAVTFAYISNKIWVFESRGWDRRTVLREAISFGICRLATGILDLAVMYISVDLLGCNDLIMKVISNASVIVLNFIFSKLVIFKSK